MTPAIVTDGHIPVSGTFDPKTADADDEAQGKSSSPGRVKAGCVELTRPILSAIPIVDFLSHLVFCVAVAFLNFALELIAASVDGRQVVVSQFSPLLFDFPFDLFPVSFHAIPIHFRILSLIDVFGRVTVMLSQPLDSLVAALASLRRTAGIECATVGSAGKV